MGEDYNGATADAMEEQEKKGTGGCADNEGKGKANKSKQQQQKHKKEDGKGRMKASSSTAVGVLGVDLHCDGCAHKVVKAVRVAQGVEGVAVDVAAGTVTVTGEGVVDPWDLKDRIESRTNKHVAFLCPPNPPPPPRKKTDDAGKGSGKTTADDDGKKNKKVNTLINTLESTVLVKIRRQGNGYTACTL